MSRLHLETEKLSTSQIDDLRLASAKLSGAKRRSFQAEISLKYCGGSPRLTETIFHWSRETVELGLGEKRTGIKETQQIQIKMDNGSESSGVRTQFLKRMVDFA
ncbi:MAG: hypothetical protein LH679_24455 [Cyanobacteria bacterium CAN_BIN43]|nr:hypothetical protein [Cyanobacteria bacterium CAN_BIN43]